MRSVKLFWLDLDEVQSRLLTAAQQLTDKHPEIQEVWLFGSVAQGRAVSGSDADLFLFLKESDVPFLERSAYYQPEFCGLGVDLFAYTQKELEEMAGTGHPFLKRITTERICLLQRHHRR